jgi:translation elongation factor EF-1beta
MSKAENCSKNQEKNMKLLVKKHLRNAAAFALFGGMIFVMPVALQAKTKTASTVDVTVRVHGSDINVSTDVLEESVEKLLEAAEIHIVKEGDGVGIIELKIDIYKNDDGNGFKADCNWDEDDEPEMEKRAETQDQIDDIVEEEVDAFISFLQKS